MLGNSGKYLAAFVKGAHRMQIRTFHNSQTFAPIGRFWVPGGKRYNAQPPPGAREPAAGPGPGPVQARARPRGGRCLPCNRGARG